MTKKKSLAGLLTAVSCIAWLIIIIALMFTFLRGELKNESRYLAFTLTEGSDPVAARLLAAAELCGLSPEAVDTTLPSEAGESISLRYTLSVANGDLRSFLLYLAMDAPHYRPLGLYAHLGHET